MISQGEAARELLRRDRAAASLPEYALAIDVPGKPVGEDEDGWLFKPVESSLALHHRVLLEFLQRIMERPGGRGMVFMPPGSAKSTYASVVAPTWYMGKHPGAKIILGSYGSDLARRHGRRARQVCRSDKFSSIGSGVPTISADTSAANEWSLTNGSEYLAGGILSGLTGNRANGIIIDDPVKGRQEADSSVIQARTREEYEDSIKTRLIPGGWMLLIQTRWSENDLAGYILPEDYAGQSGLIKCRDGNEWEILNIPAEAEHADDPLGRKIGEMLWPEWFTTSHWAQFRSNARTWSALFQQRPNPPEGLKFKVSNITRIDRRPEHLVIVAASDLATKKEGGDFTEHGVVGIDHEGRWWVLDWWGKQEESDVWTQSKIDLIQKHRPVMWFDEKGPIYSATWPFFQKQLQKRYKAGDNVLTRFESLASMQGKEERADGLAGLIAMGMLNIPNTEWGARLYSQLQKFPNDVFDDAVDVLTVLQRGQTQFGHAIMPKQRAKYVLPPPNTVRVQDLEAEDDEAPRSRYGF